MAWAYGPGKCRCVWVPVAFILAWCMAVSSPGDLRGQADFLPASPLLPPGHWSHAALTRLHGAGLLPHRFDPATTTVARAEALRMFQNAAEMAGEARPAWRELTEGYRDRFSEEFQATAHRSADGGGVRAVVDASVLVGFESRRNGLLARHQPSEDSDLGTSALADLADPAVVLELGVQLPTAGSVSFAGRTSIDVRDGRMTASEAYALMLVRRLGVWAGRRQLGFGGNDGGSVVLNTEVPFDGVGLFLADGLHLPGPLRHLGYVQLETLFSQMDRSGDVEAPWFFGLRTAVSPHPRVQVGVNRGAHFAGRGERVPDATVGRIFKMIAGIDTAEPGAENFDDHVASMDFWFRPPLGDLPLVVYGEWGVEDLQAQRRDMPAFVTGARLVEVPGVAWMSLGLERTSFGAPESGRMGWYEHRVFGTWTDQGRLLAHRLGGEGREWRAYSTADFIESRLRMEGRMYTRRRTGRNLFSPEREGSSRGVEAALRWRLAPSLEFEGWGVWEGGDGWRSRLGFVGIRYLF